VKEISSVEWIIDRRRRKGKTQGHTQAQVEQGKEGGAAEV